MTDIQHIELISSNGDSRVVVSTWGARVIEWKHRGVDVIFRNEMLARDEIAATHCGIPVLFPQFGAFGVGEFHGIAYKSLWQIDEVDESNCKLSLSGSSGFPANNGEVRYVATVAANVSEDQLSLSLRINNSGVSNLEFTAGLHTYISVDDVQRTQIKGLSKRRYLDATDDMRVKTQNESILQIVEGCDRVYLNGGSQLIVDSDGTIVSVSQSGFADTVIWNPGWNSSEKFDDFVPQEWRKFVCLEPAQISDVVTLRPGEEWEGSQIICR